MSQVPGSNGSAPLSAGVRSGRTPVVTRTRAQTGHADAATGSHFANQTENSVTVTSGFVVPSAVDKPVKASARPQDRRQAFASVSANASAPVVNLMAAPNAVPGAAMRAGSRTRSSRPVAAPVRAPAVLDLSAMPTHGSAGADMVDESPRYPNAVATRAHGHQVYRNDHPSFAAVAAAAAAAAATESDDASLDASLSAADTSAGLPMADERPPTLTAMTAESAVYGDCVPSNNAANHHYAQQPQQYAGASVFGPAVPPPASATDSVATGYVLTVASASGSLPGSSSASTSSANSGMIATANGHNNGLNDPNSSRDLGSARSHVHDLTGVSAAATGGGASPASTVAGDANMSFGQASTRGLASDTSDSDSAAAVNATNITNDADARIVSHATQAADAAQVYEQAHAQAQAQAQAEAHAAAQVQAQAQAQAATQAQAQADAQQAQNQNAPPAMMGGVRDPCEDYEDEIYFQLVRAEMANCPRPDYIENVQTDLTHTMRSILIDWLVEVVEEYQLAPQTLFLAIHYVDRMLSKEPVHRAKLQLVGVAAVLIAAKYEDVHPPLVDQLVFISDNSYERSEVLRMETVMLTTLNFGLTLPTALDFCYRYARAGNVTGLGLHIAMFIIELAAQEPLYIGHRPSAIAAAAVFLTRYILLTHHAHRTTLAQLDALRDAAVLERGPLTSHFRAKTSIQVQRLPRSTVLNASQTAWPRAMAYLTRFALPTLSGCILSMNHMLICAMGFGANLANPFLGSPQPGVGEGLLATQTATDDAPAPMKALYLKYAGPAYDAIVDRFLPPFDLTAELLCDELNNNHEGLPMM